MHMAGGKSSDSQTKRGIESYYNKEYRLAYPVIKKYFDEVADEEAKNSIRQLDDEFHSGNFQGLIDWARSIDESLFAPIPNWMSSPYTEWPYDFAPLDYCVEPGWWEQHETLYHGSRTRILLATQGLDIPCAEWSLTDEYYGWKALWKDIIWYGYKSLLNKKQRDIVCSFYGEAKLLKRDMGELFSLLYVTDNIDIARQYGSSGAVFSAIQAKFVTSGTAR